MIGPRSRLSEKSKLHSIRNFRAAIKNRRRSILMAFVKSAQGCGQAFMNWYVAASKLPMIALAAQNRSQRFQPTYDNHPASAYFPTRTQLDETKISRHHRARLLQAIDGRPSATGPLPGGLGKSSIRKDTEMVCSLGPCSLLPRLPVSNPLGCREVAWVGAFCRT
jgi:hypothetical protein